MLRAKKNIMATTKNVHSFQLKSLIKFTGTRDNKPAGKMVRNTILYQPVKIDAGWLAKVMKEMNTLSPSLCESLIKNAKDDIIKRIENIRINAINEQKSIMPNAVQLT